MNGNNPYAGASGVTGAGQTSADRKLTVDRVDALRWVVTGIVSRTESYLPERFTVGFELSTGANGPPATVAVYPPVGHSVNADFSLDADDLNAGPTDEGRNEVAHGLAASAAFQVMSAVGDDLTLAVR